MHLKSLGQNLKPEAVTLILFKTRLPSEYETPTIKAALAIPSSTVLSWTTDLIILTTYHLKTQDNHPNELA